MAAASHAQQITSRDNRWLKRFRAALRTSQLERDGVVAIEGVRGVGDALRSGLSVEALLVSSSGERQLARLRATLREWSEPTHLLHTTDRLFASVADTETPQGIAALVRLRAASFDDLVRGVALVVVLVGVQDPGNVGTIVRAAEGFRATGVAVCAAGGTGTANPFAPKALRASAGSALRLPIVQGISTSILLAQLRLASVKLYASSPPGDPPATTEPPCLRPWEADLRAPSALLIGNEGAGLPDEVERAADAVVHIPLGEAVESLNTAVAASLLLYEAAKQRGDLSGSHRWHSRATGDMKTLARTR